MIHDIERSYSHAEKQLLGFKKIDGERSPTAEDIDDLMRIKRYAGWLDN